MPYVHLHLHDTYSLLDGYGTPDAFAKASAKQGMIALAQTNHGTISGHVAHKNACAKAGVHAVYGCEFYVARDMTVRGLTPEQELDIKERAANKAEAEKMRKEMMADARLRLHLLVLAQNDTGYSNLRTLVSKSHLDGFYHKPRIDLRTLVVHKEGLFISSACMLGDIPQRILAGEMDKARALAESLKSEFGANFLLEIMPFDMDDQRIVNKGIGALAVLLGIPVIATNDVHYVGAGDAWAQDVLLAIGTNSRMTDKNRFRFGGGELFLRTEEQMAFAFKTHHPELTPEFIRLAMENTYSLAFKCNADPLKSVTNLPRFPIPAGFESDNEFLTHLCRVGWANRRLGGSDAASKTRYTDRVKYELTLIADKGFANYFLITWDAVRWSREQGIMVGPARGSSAGSLVSFLLSITEIDPLRFGLSFERFISPHRTDYPDIDIDFEDARRHEVKAYLASQYGEDCVANVGTMNELKFRSAFRDASRVYAVPQQDVNRILDLIPDDMEIDNEHDPALPPEVAEFRRKYPDVVKAAIALQGQMRSGGTHAAGMVLADRPLMDVTALELRGGAPVVALTKDEAEALGLVKFDILGLKTMSVFAETLRLVNPRRETEGKEPLTLTGITTSLDDPGIIAEFAAGNTEVVFQFNKPGGKRLCQQIGVRTFNDLALVNALDRPGPLQSGGTDEFVARRKGAPVEYVHNAYRNVSSETLGVLLYQEQVMQLCREMAALDWADIHAIRKAIAKSKGAKALEAFWEKFRDGAAATCECSETVARTVWDSIVKWGGYAFNKSHSVAYAAIAYACMWFKVYYPAEFLCAAMKHGAEMGLREAVLEARRREIKVSEPDVNASGLGYQLRDGTIYAGLDAVKGIGHSAAAAIVEGRGDAPFKSIRDLVDRVDARKAHKGVTRALCEVGAFASLHGDTAALLTFHEELYASRKKGVFGAEVPAALSSKSSRTNLTVEQVSRRAALLPFIPEFHPGLCYPDVLKRLDRLYPKRSLIAELRSAGRAYTRNETRTIAATMTKMETKNMDGGRRGKVGLCRVEDESGEIVIRLDYKRFGVEVDVLHGEEGLPIVAVVSSISEYRADVREIAELGRFKKALADERGTRMTESMERLVEMPGRVIIPLRNGQKTLKRATRLKRPTILALAMRVWSGDTKRGTMGFVDMADESGQQIVLIWPDSWKFLDGAIHEGHVYEAQLHTLQDRTLACDVSRGNGFRDVTPSEMLERSGE